MGSGRRRWRELLWRAVLVVGPILISGALWIVARTARVRFVGLEDLFERWRRGERVILAFWHNRVVMMPPQCRGRKVCILNSAHRDGELATRALARWGIRSVRGSATRGGVAGFLRLVSAYRAGFDLAIVPDGPRGPRYRVKPGVLHLAKATGAPIYPVSCAARWKKELKSWDRMIIPLPFSKLVYVGAEPVVVPRDASDEAIEKLRDELEARLTRATREAENACAA